MENKSKTGAIIGTIVAALLCGCPGLSLCLFGVYAATGTMPDFISGYGNLPGWIGFILICLSLIFIAIPIVVGVLTLRKKPEAVMVSADEPLPPPA
ncbi:MAG: hypothetical protein Q7U34_12050 [Anaerolineales bacterium]|nr:hypothetical protein [Anaerolineales bacterium]